MDEHSTTTLDGTTGLFRGAAWFDPIQRGAQIRRIGAATPIPFEVKRCGHSSGGHCQLRAGWPEPRDRARMAI